MKFKPIVSKTRVIINVTLFVLFTLFALVQLNDPDPIHWFLLYEWVAVLSLVAIFRNIPKLIIWLSIFVLLVYDGTLVTYFVDWMKIDHKEELFGKMVYEKPYLEGTREFLGVIMAVMALLFHLKKSN